MGHKESSITSVVFSNEVFDCCVAELPLEVMFCDEMLVIDEVDDEMVEGVIDEENVEDGVEVVAKKIPRLARMMITTIITVIISLPMAFDRVIG